MTFIPPVVNTQAAQRNYNVPIYGVRGEFSLSSTVKVPYFIALMELNRVTGELKTHDEVSPSLEATYSLVELFQRQIDIDRVRREIVDGYLRIPNKIKFFNSLTIVLLPKNEEGKIVSTFENYENNDPPIPDTQFGSFDTFFAGEAVKSKAVFGGVQFVTTVTENLARLRWDMKRVDAVAVDGQHRLRALKTWMEDRNNQLSDTERPTRIPIIFLMLHQEAGFVGDASGPATGIKGIAREIFTDLNKNARQVDLATQIILDDLSVESCCARALVTPATCSNDAILLPLTLLRWQDANHRFDKNYYLNSLVNLHLLVKDLLRLKTFDPMTKKDVLDFIRHATSLLGTGSPRALRHEGVTLEEYYLKNFFDPEEDEPVTPFPGIPSHYLPNAVDGFKEHFAPWLLSLLKKFEPYGKLINYAEKNDLISGQFGQYLSQPRRHQEQLNKDLEFEHGKQWRKQLIDQHVEEIEKIKGNGTELGEQWAFKTIFQKAVVRLGQQIFVNVASDEQSRFGSVEEYLSFLNSLYQENILRVHAPLGSSSHGAWTFIAVNFGSKTIKVSASSEARILSVLRLWYFALRYAKDTKRDLNFLGGKSEIGITPREIIKHFGTHAAQAKWPNINEDVNVLLSTFKTEAAANAIAGKQLGTEAERDKVARERLEQLLVAGLLPFKPKPETLEPVGV